MIRTGETQSELDQWFEALSARGASYRFAQDEGSIRLISHL